MPDSMIRSIIEGDNTAISEGTHLSAKRTQIQRFLSYVADVLAQPLLTVPGSIYSERTCLPILPWCPNNVKVVMLVQGHCLCKNSACLCHVGLFVSGIFGEADIEIMAMF